MCLCVSLLRCANSAVLCVIVLLYYRYCAVLCYAVLQVLCCVMLCCVVLCDLVCSYFVFFFDLHCVVLCCVVLCFVAPFLLPNNFTCVRRTRVDVATCCFNLDARQATPRPPSLLPPQPRALIPYAKSVIVQGWPRAIALP